VRKYLRHCALLVLALFAALGVCLIAACFSWVVDVAVDHFPVATFCVVFSALVAYCYHELKGLT
jgi:hypothetical protein